MYTLIVFEEADQELQEAAVWYEEKSIGLGLRFIDIVKRKLEIVRQNPEKNARKKGNFRQSVIKTFPYVIVYTFYKKEGIITVSSILSVRHFCKIKGFQKLLITLSFWRGMGEVIKRSF